MRLLTPAQVEAQNAKLAKWRAEGRIRTNRIGTKAEVAGKESLQSRLEGAKQPKFGANGGKVLPKVVLGPKIAPKPPNKPRTHVFPGLPPATCEFVFAAPRKWRFDYAWQDFKVALEIEGGVWTAGRHTRGKGFLADMEKYNEAACRSWKVIRATPEQVESGAIFATLKRLVF